MENLIQAGTRGNCKTRRKQAQTTQRGTAATEWKINRIMAGQNHGEPKQNQGWLTTIGGAV
jgi:hypothetical protein